jgi:hypothetical protein
LFSKLFKKEKPRVYLGALMVAPADKWHEDDGWGFFKSENLEEGLRKSLRESINLPSIGTSKKTRESDLGLEIAIIKHQGGDFQGINAGELFIPILYRPKVEIRARLYNIATGKTVNSSSVIKKTPWGEYFQKVFSLNGFFRFRPLFNSKDMEILLCKAGIDVLRKLSKKL